MAEDRVAPGTGFFVVGALLMAASFAVGINAAPEQGDDWGFSAFRQIMYAAAGLALAFVLIIVAFVRRARAPSRRLREAEAAVPRPGEEKPRPRRTGPAPATPWIHQ